MVNFLRMSDDDGCTVGCFYAGEYGERTRADEWWRRKKIDRLSRSSCVYVKKSFFEKNQKAEATDDDTAPVPNRVKRGHAIIVLLCV